MPPKSAVPELEGLSIYERSLVEINGTSYFLVSREGAGAKLLGVNGDWTDLAGAQPGPGEINARCGNKPRDCR